MRLLFITPGTGLIHIGAKHKFITRTSPLKQAAGELVKQQVEIGTGRIFKIGYMAYLKIMMIISGALFILFILFGLIGLYVF